MPGRLGDRPREPSVIVSWPGAEQESLHEYNLLIGTSVAAVLLAVSVVGLAIRHYW